MKRHTREPSERPTLYELRALQRKLGYVFANKELLIQALTHHSVRPGENMDMLELFGDTAVNHILGLLLEERYPTADQSDIARMRGQLKTNAYLATIALRLRLKPLFRRRHRKFHFSEHTLGSMVEAVIGAVGKDGGFEQARAVCRKLFRSEIELVWYDDPFGQLTELLLKSQGERPRASVEQKTLSPDGSSNGYVGIISTRSENGGKPKLLASTDAFCTRDAIEWAAAKALHELLEGMSMHHRYRRARQVERIRVVAG